MKSWSALSGILGACGVVVLACSGSVPERIDFKEPPPVIVNSTFMRLGASVVNARGKPVRGVTVTYAAVPEGILEVSPKGELRCMKAGDAILVMTGGGLTADVPLKCRIPTEIQMPAEMELLLGSKPALLKPVVLGEGGKVLKDVPVEIASSNPEVVAVEGRKVKPLMVGRARLKATVEAIAAVTPVQVVEKLVSETLAMPGGSQRSWPLKDGTYRVKIDVKPDVRVNQGVMVAWDRAACPNQPERQSHDFRCRVDDTGTITVMSPKALGLAANMRGSIAIYRVPSD